MLPNHMRIEEIRQETLKMLGIEHESVSHRSSFDLGAAGRVLLDQLMEIRDRRGLTSSYIADETGFPIETIQQLENSLAVALEDCMKYAVAVGAHVDLVVRPLEDLVSEYPELVDDVYEKNPPLRDL